MTFNLDYLQMLSVQMEIVMLGTEQPIAHQAWTAHTHSYKL